MNDRELMKRLMSGEIRTTEYKIKSNNIEIEAHDESDHRRALEAIQQLHALVAAQALARVPEPSQQRTARTSEACQAWLGTFDNTKSRSTASASINQFIALHGDMLIHEIKPIHIVEFNAKLLKSGLSARSADNRLQHIQSLLRYAQKQEYVSSEKPLATEGKFNLTKSQRIKQTRGADAFSVAELTRIFEPENYERYCKKNGTRRSPARYWMPVIALFTGMRLEEVAGLKKEDVREINNIAFFDVNDRTRSIKTEAGRRAIPVHQTLVDLGFNEYLRGLQGGGSLFPELKRGNEVSKVFIRYLETIEVRKNGDRSKVFHSLRDTFNNMLECAGVGEHVRFALMGHALQSTNAQSYLTPANLSRLKEEGTDKLIFRETSGGEVHELLLKKQSPG